MLVSDKQIIDVIQKHRCENLTIRKLMKLLGLHSTSAVHRRIKKLEENGLITVRTVRMTIIDVGSNIDEGEEAYTEHLDIRP